MRVLSAMLFVFLLSFMAFPELGFVSDELRPADVFLADSTYNEELGNLAPNPSFEDGGEAGPTGWEYEDPGDSTIFLWDNDSSHSGSSSIGIYGRNPYTFYSWRTTQLIPVDLTKNYVFSVWYKFEGTPDPLHHAELMIYEYDENGVFLGRGFGITVVFNDTIWQYVELDCTHTKFFPATAHVELSLRYIYFSNATDVQVRFDDVNFSLRTLIIPDDHLTIQGAINSAGKGDTVFVRSGVYYENVVVNKTLALIGEGRENTVIDANHTGSVVTIAADDILLTGLTIRNSEDNYHCGVGVWNVLGIYVSECNVDNNFRGFDFSNSQNCILRNNSISNNVNTGIWMSGPCKNNTFHQNIISHNKWGVQAVHSNQNTYSENRVFLNEQYGIYLAACHENLLLKNHVHGSIIGIGLMDCQRNTLQENNFYDCSTGVRLRNDFPENLCLDNVFHHNNFVNAPANPYLAQQNIWDNGCEGNYWSNYDGSDLDGDGIGDTPHTLTPNNTDHYPLMNPYWHPADVNKNLRIDIYDAVLLCASYNTTPSDPNWNCHCDIAEPFGFIDESDVMLIADNYGEEYQGP